MKNRLFTRMFAFFVTLAAVCSLIPSAAVVADAAPASDIPVSMVDSSIMRAWSYLSNDQSYDPVQYLKDSGKLFKEWGPEYNSGIPYPANESTCAAGSNWKYDASGNKVPDLATLRNSGMVCGSFAAYYLFSYLPYIEGADHTAFREYAYNYQSTSGLKFPGVLFWWNVMNYCAKDTETYGVELLWGGASAEGIFDNNYENIPDNVYARMVPGDVVILGHTNGAGGNTELTHIGIYAGTYNGNHFYIHCGSSSNSGSSPSGTPTNGNGPYMTRIEDQRRYDLNNSKLCHPIGVYHLDWIPDAATGRIEVLKTDPNGVALNGAYFSVVNNSDTSLVYILGPTHTENGKNGYASIDELPFGTYTVTETKAPDGYELSTQTWTVTLNASTPNATVTLNIVNQPSLGKLIIQKRTNTGQNLAGWIFEVTNSSGTIVGTVTTDETGYAKLENLDPGSYKITEIGGPPGVWDSGEWAFDVEASGGVVVYATENLIENSDFSNGKTGWQGSNATTIGVTTFDNRTVMKIDASTGTSSTGYCVRGGIKNVTAGTYTLSGWIYLEQAQSVIANIWTSDSGSWVTVKAQSFACNAGWNYISFTFTTSTDYTTLLAGYGISQTKGIGYLWQPVLQAGSYPNGIESTEGEIYYGMPNLLQNSDFANGTSLWTGKDGTNIALVSQDGRSCLKVTPSAGTSATGFVCQSGIDEVYISDYTLSGWVYTEQAQTITLNLWTNTDTVIGTKSITTEAGWNYVEATFELTNSYTSMNAGIGGQKGDAPFLLWHPKLEMGSYATDWTPGVKTRSVTITRGQTTTHYVTNMKTDRGDGEIIKITPSGGTKEGWHIVIKDSDGNTVFDGYTDTNGAIAVRLAPGSYKVYELGHKTISNDDLANYWIMDPEASTGKDIEIVVGRTSTVEFTNEFMGVGKIQKETTANGLKEGWIFEVRKLDENGNEILPGVQYVTDANGLIAEQLTAGTYMVYEIGHRDFTDDENAYWQMDPSAGVGKELVVVAGETSSVVRFRNEWWGKVKIIKSLLNPEAGTVDGWTFTITDKSTGTLIGTYQTGIDGTFTVDLVPGVYIVEEILADDSPWICTNNPQEITVAAGQTAAVYFENTLQEGRIELLKVSSIGFKLPGARFLLEWSDDGRNWQAVHSRTGSTPAKGSCTTPGLIDGILETDDTGIIAWEGLYPGLYYRITEIKAPDGYTLLSDYAYLGELPADTLELKLKVVNAGSFKFPATGITDMIPMGMTAGIILAIALVGIGVILYIPKRKARIHGKDR